MRCHFGWSFVSGTALAFNTCIGGQTQGLRNTVLSAFDQLFAEGYTKGQIGSGTQVSRILPEDVLAARASPKNRDELHFDLVTSLSIKGNALLKAKSRVRRDTSGHAFRPGIPEITRFPWNNWSRMIAKLWRNPPRSLVSYGEVSGHEPLRIAIVDYLCALRGLVCDADQVIITSGAQQAIDLIARALLNAGDKVWIEDPGYAGIKGVLMAAGDELVPLPVDEQVLVVVEGVRQAPGSRMAEVTPSHQYPLGAMMSLSRRLELLKWAGENNAWILEDNYDSEYRYAGRPLSALQGLDTKGRVIYVSTFSKVMFPAVRMGYMVMPKGLAQPMIDIRRSLDDQTAIVMQPVLTEFIESGHFAQHIRRMRSLYADRQQTLLDAIKLHLNDVLEIAPDDAGMHIVAHIRPECGLVDAKIAEQAVKHKLTLFQLSEFYLGKSDRNGLVLGYAGVEERDIVQSVKKLAKIIAALRK